MNHKFTRAYCGCVLFTGCSFSSTHIHVDSESDSDSETEASSVNSTAAIMLSSPHFTEVERLLQRFSNVLPGMPVLGGVCEPDAWGETEHSFGALFLGGRVFCNVRKCR